MFFEKMHEIRNFTEPKTQQTVLPKTPLKRSDLILESAIHNTSEIGRLRRVLLHRPGRELENLMPEYLERLLFDDIPYLREAQEEHDAFADCLRAQGVEVVYLADLVAESLTGPEVRQTGAGVLSVPDRRGRPSHHPHQRRGGLL